jgi:hypothetical protein
MKSVINQKLVKRNALIGQYTSLGALGILAIGLYISFKAPDKILYSLGALLVGFFLSQVGIYYGNRWNRKPRPDEVIDRSLKGMGREYIIYHYVTPAAHLLLGPAGAWILLPYFQSGTISYSKNRWRIKGGGFTQWYMRVFGQENLGRPDADAAAESHAVTAYLDKLLPEGVEVPEIKAALMFFHPDAKTELDEAPLPALAPGLLKDFLKEKAKDKPIDPETLATVQGVLPKAGKEEE